MNAENFVEIIRKVVAEGSTKGVASVLQKPSGRKPAQKLVDMSNWYNQLNENDKTVVGQVIKQSVESAVFRFLCVLDGVTAIENENKGELRLYYVNTGIQEFLNDPSEEFLHDLFNVAD